MLGVQYLWVNPHVLGLPLLVAVVIVRVNRLPLRIALLELILE